MNFIENTLLKNEKGRFSIKAASFILSIREVFIKEKRGKKHIEF